MLDETIKFRFYVTITITLFPILAAVWVHVGSRGRAPPETKGLGSLWLIFMYDSYLISEHKALSDFPFLFVFRAIMSLTNGHTVSKETWDSHNKMMLEPLAVSDSEVCFHWI